jgi:hypothetical protein
VKIYDVPTHALEDIAREVGVCLYGDDVSNSRGDRWAGRLVPDNYSTRGGSLMAKYQRTSATNYSERNGRYWKVHAVCWHGYRDFFRVLFSRFPTARVSTMFADYRGAADFLTKYPETAWRNVGSQFYPRNAEDVCECDVDVGIAYVGIVERAIEAATIRQGYPHPIAYTYNAAFHCPVCAARAFGVDDNGFIPEGATDSEGNGIGAVAPWDEWHEPSEPLPQALSCDTCGGIIETLEGVA